MSEENIVAVEQPTSPSNDQVLDNNQNQVLALLMEKFEQLTQKLAEVQSRPPVVVQAAGSGVPRNKVRQIPDPATSYVLQSTDVAWGKVPAQQAAIAEILATGLEVGARYKEFDVFELIEDQYINYPALANSDQDACYIFKYYRNIAKGKVAGYYQRGFLTQVKETGRVAA